MEELKAIFASNLIKLRAEAGLTQAELGEKIHYSDKSISKWERAEAIPDAYVLTLLAEVFGVSVSALLTGEEEWRYIEKPEEKPVEYSRPTVISCTIAGIWTLCLVEFVLMWILGHVYWIILLAAVPITLVTLLVFNSVWYAGRRNMYIIGALVLSIALILALELRAWQILLLIPPAEIVVYLACHIRRREKQE
ncbi:MAG: helix-turn-helix transcriptional regulator [Oscillospiraceae bacterium]|nr:helix-turn-helix transcriptional regulator [Oscillospiraceae bacterium]